MPATDLLKAFSRVQPRAGADGAVTAREFVDAQTRIEQAISGLVKFCRNVMPTGALMAVPLTVAEVGLYFDTTGRGVAGRQYEGWAIANGNNGTTDEDGRFIRFNTAGGDSVTGGSDSSAHTHSVDPASFTSGAESAHTHGAADTANGSLHARVDMTSSDDILYLDRVLGNWTSEVKADFTVGGMSVVADSTAKTAATAVAGVTAAGSSHTHAIDVPATTSGAASVTDNRPAYREWVPIMRL